MDANTMAITLPRDDSPSDKIANCTNLLRDARDMKLNVLVAANVGVLNNLKGHHAIDPTEHAVSGVHRVMKMLGRKEADPNIITRCSIDVWLGTPHFLNHADHETLHPYTKLDFATEKGDTAALMLHLGHILTTRKQFSKISRLRVFILLPTSLCSDSEVAGSIQTELQTLIHDTRLGVARGQIDVVPWPHIDSTARPRRADRCAALASTIASTSGAGSSVVMLELPQLPAHSVSDGDDAEYIRDIRSLSCSSTEENQAMVFLSKYEPGHVITSAI
jgi:hypothetical protein